MRHLLYLALLAAGPTRGLQPTEFRPVPGFSLHKQDDVVALIDGAGQRVGTVRCHRIVDIALLGDRALLLLASSAAGGTSLVEVTAAPSRRQEARAEVWTEGFLHIHLLRELGHLRPWKVRLVDVDGDGGEELVLGVYKRARFDPMMRNRLFVYTWPGLAPRWLGSRLSLPFDDFVFVDCDQDGKDELIALERAADGRRRLMRYRWNGFGFSGEAGDFLEVTSRSELIAARPNGARLRDVAATRFCPRKEPHP